MDLSPNTLPEGNFRLFRNREGLSDSRRGPQGLNGRWGLGSLIFVLTRGLNDGRKGQNLTLWGSPVSFLGTNCSRGGKGLSEG